jgi:hypothetical protein
MIKRLADYAPWDHQKLPTEIAQLGRPPERANPGPFPVLPPSAEILAQRALQRELTPADIRHCTNCDTLFFVDGRRQVIVGHYNDATSEVKWG